MKFIIPLLFLVGCLTFGGCGNKAARNVAAEADQAAVDSYKAAYEESQAAMAASQQERDEAEAASE